jgi:hypothetical protein
MSLGGEVESQSVDCSITGDSGKSAVLLLHQSRALRHSFPFTMSSLLIYALHSKQFSVNINTTLTCAHEAFLLKFGCLSSTVLKAYRGFPRSFLLNAYRCTDTV